MGKMKDHADGKTYELEADTLSGDIRDVILTHMRAMKVGWSFLSEREQQDKIDAAVAASTQLVRQTIGIIVNYEFPNLAVDVGAVKIDKGLEIKLGAMSTVANITSLAEHGKARAVLVLADPDVFFGEKAAARPEPDQTSILTQ